MIPAQTRVINDMLEAASRACGTPRTYLGMSQIGERCARKLWYGFRGYTPDPANGRMQMIFDLGHRVEEAVLHWLKTAGYRIECEQQEFSAHAGLFRGHCDGIIYGVSSHPHILEIKSANDRRFKAFQQQGIRAISTTYYCQAQCYMGYSGLERTLFVIMNKNTCELYVERVRFSQDDFRALHERAYEIITSNTPPPRLSGAHFKDESCEWCKFHFFCLEPQDAPYRGVQTDYDCGCCSGFAMRGLHPVCEFSKDAPLDFSRRKETARACALWSFREHSDVPF